MNSALDQAIVPEHLVQSHRHMICVFGNILLTSLLRRSSFMFHTFSIERFMQARSSPLYIRLGKFTITHT